MERKILLTRHHKIEIHLESEGWKNKESSSHSDFEWKACNSIWVNENERPERQHLWKGVSNSLNFSVCFWARKKKSFQQSFFWRRPKGTWCAQTSLNKQVLTQYRDEASELEYGQCEHDLCAVAVKERRFW